VAKHYCKRRLTQLAILAKLLQELASVINTDWTEGMSSSIHCALSHLDKLTGRSDAALFTVADLAYVDAAHFFKLIDTYATSNVLVVCSAYADKDTSDSKIMGVPALFSRKLFPDLMALSGDIGAKKIIGKYSDRMVSVELESASFDVDTEADYLRLCAT
jgi:molybdenum cofactor cytidylyltransferase